MARPTPSPSQGTQRKGLTLGAIAAWTGLIALALGAGVGLSLWRGQGGGPVGLRAPATAEVVAEVNGVPITSRDVDIEYAVQKDLQQRLAGKVLDDTMPAAVASFRRDLVDRLIDRWLVTDAATKAGLTVDAAAVQAAVAALDSRFSLPAGTIRQAILASPSGLTDDDVSRWAGQQVLAENYIKRPDAQAIIQKWAVERGPAQDLVEPVAQSLMETADVKLHIDGRVVAPVRVGQPAPDLELPGPDGVLRKLSDFRGRPVMLNFWATWCGPCRAEIPLFVNAYQKNKDQLVVLGVNSQETPALVTPFMQSFKIEYPMVIDGDGKVSSIYRVKALPTTFFLDSQGIVVEAVRGTIHSRPELNEFLGRIMDAPQGRARTLSERLALGR